MGRITELCPRFGLLGTVLLIVFLSGCSSSSDWFSRNDDSPLPPPLQTDADGVVPDETGRKEEKSAAQSGPTGADDETTDAGAATDAAAGEADNAVKPQRQLANSLVSDKEKARHSDEELRGGRVAPVAAPRPSPPSAKKPDAPVMNRETDAAAPSAPALPQGKVSGSVLAPPQPRQNTVAQAARANPAAPQVARLVPPAATAQSLSPRGVPAITAAPIPAPIPVSPAALGALPPGAYPGATFQPSRAQPLPPELLANLPPGIAERYRETSGATVIGATPRSVYSGGASAIIPFASGSTRLSSADLRAIKTTARMYLDRRGNRIRVVGHASSNTSSRSASEQLIANWEISQARANAVADALIADGIPASEILIEAVGDGQPALEGPDMEAEAVNRRVDIYLE